MNDDIPVMIVCSLDSTEFIYLDKRRTVFFLFLNVKCKVQLRQLHAERDKQDE